jgi:hypothetical protein
MQDMEHTFREKTKGYNKEKIKTAKQEFQKQWTEEFKTQIKMKFKRLDDNHVQKVYAIWKQNKDEEKKRKRKDENIDD